MKTILIMIAGMADIVDAKSGHDTPLVEAHKPALDMMAQRGELLSFPPLHARHAVSHKNALLSMLGYDLDRGEPSIEELMEYGLDSSSNMGDYPSLRPFIIPLFSGHGICVTTSAWVRGVAKCFLIKPVDIYSPGSSDTEILSTMATLATQAISERNEFVLVYVDTPLKASLRGDYEGKVKALEDIDRYLISPIADFVWKSDLLINMAVATELTTSWRTGNPLATRVPVVAYFNNHDWEGDPDHRFTEVESMLRDKTGYLPGDMMRYLYTFSASDDEDDLL